jgi:glycogen synthase
MRILLLSNFYPPHTIGGMERRCQETVELLQQRGHEIAVLTSTYGVTAEGLIEDNVYRLLALESDLMHYRPLHFFLKSGREEKQNLNILASALDQFGPDLVFIWGMWNLSRQLPFYVEQNWPGPVVYSLANDWPAQPDAHEAYWRLPARHRFLQPFKSVVTFLALSLWRRQQRKISLHFERVICVSHSLCQQLLQSGAPLQQTEVIHPGIDLHQFTNSRGQPETHRSPGLSLLYAGSLVPHKGVHTAVEALTHLLRQDPDLRLNLTIVGSGHVSYEAHLHALVTNNRLEDYIRFVRQIPREEMPDLMRQFDVLLFPSVWEEPFSRVVLEAMAMGLVVVGTMHGGTKEILQHGQNGLSFEAEDAYGLALAIKKLYDPKVRVRLAKQGEAIVKEKFDLQRMVDQIEAFLLQVVSAGTGNGLS